MNYQLKRKYFLQMLDRWILDRNTGFTFAEWFIHSANKEYIGEKCNIYQIREKVEKLRLPIHIRIESPEGFTDRFEIV